MLLRYTIGSIGILENYDIKKFRGLIKNPEEIIANSNAKTIGENIGTAVGANN